MATYDQLTEWAGLGHVTRAGWGIVSGWRIPDAMKAQLVEVGIPVAPRLIERVVMQSEADPVLLTSRGPLYRLTEQVDPYEAEERSSFGVEPETGAVYFVLPDGEAWFANSGVKEWLDVLHCYGSREALCAMQWTSGGAHVASRGARSVRCGNHVASTRPANTSRAAG
ncbi:SUKH-4 family immunity protein [Streptomyces sp. NPDC001595]|uniref:SUKH-4 family immunity protein n=1 Tax=Streptomyces sp. NPDC001532 TaxID=3154520 RepID=UPI00332AEB8B